MKKTRVKNLMTLASYRRENRFGNRQNRETEIFCQISPLILTKVCNDYICCGFYNGFPFKGLRTDIRFCKDSRGVIKFTYPSVSLRPQDI
jgi:hypothetical protein